jgi:hypothetical protein
MNPALRQLAAIAARLALQRLREQQARAAAHAQALPSQRPAA